MHEDSVCAAGRASPSSAGGRGGDTEIPATCALCAPTRRMPDLLLPGRRRGRPSRVGMRGGRRGGARRPARVWAAVAHAAVRIRADRHVGEVPVPLSVRLGALQTRFCKSGPGSCGPRSAVRCLGVRQQRPGDRRRPPLAAHHRPRALESGAFPRPLGRPRARALIRVCEESPEVLRTEALEVAVRGRAHARRLPQERVGVHRAARLAGEQREHLALVVRTQERAPVEAQKAEGHAEEHDVPLAEEPVPHAEHGGDRQAVGVRAEEPLGRVDRGLHAEAGEVGAQPREGLLHEGPQDALVRAQAHHGRREVVQGQQALCKRHEQPEAPLVVARDHEEERRDEAHALHVADMRVVLGEGNEHAPQARRAGLGLQQPMPGERAVNVEANLLRRVRPDDAAAVGALGEVPGPLPCPEFCHASECLPHPGPQVVGDAAPRERAHALGRFVRPLLLGNGRPFPSLRDLPPRFPGGQRTLEVVQVLLPEEAQAVVFSGRLHLLPLLLAICPLAAHG
eukprot:CAMPEP_0205998318 /NCGR_PEP_ID=MMETSP1464-20131121/174_1 /ASSEMBLY_ACC=CAM_ASM_001124 /TAXON_ID=119497 /ORGANISM="Exanthemachrysis gayraliae, Strain RCC1523" /LENGTH=509 /DNA_ID=CAMNT_0053371461 /DNA_START=405 /DNA_END=1931 /DNA_ORIENTATION=-